MEKVKVEFETITPIFTGDAWGKNSEIKASSVMGSLRFWFEVYCHFTGIDVKEKEELKDKDYQRILQNLKKDIDDGKDIDDIDKYIFDRLPLTLSSKIFGCTGWKSRIEIESISFKENQDYSYPLGKQSFQNLQYTKEYFDKKEKKKKAKSIIPSWYFEKGCYGNGCIVFKTTNEIGDNILLPLLNFIEKYGFIGAKNNIGYGRVRFTNIEYIDTFGFKMLNEKYENKQIDGIIEEVEEVEEEVFWEKESLILIDNFIKREHNLNKLIKDLIEKKSSIRKEVEDQENRHYKLGTVRKAKWEKIDIPQAAKVIPLISKNKNGSYSGRFLSIVGIKNFGENHGL